VITCEPKLIIPADKTSNFYKIDKEQYEELRSKDVQKFYKKGKNQKFQKINKEHIQIATKLDIEDRVFKTSQQDCFVTLKDHTQTTHSRCRVIWLGSTDNLSFQLILNILVLQIPNISYIYKYHSVIHWFKQLENKKNLAFIIF
jgi:hypothetical protein